MASPVAIGDVIAVSNLAWKTIQGARKVCGEYDGLTQEVKTIYTLLQRLKRELDNSESLLNQADGESKEELGLLVDQCERALHILDVILDKYNALGDKERSGRRLWQKMRFGTGKVEDVQEQRAKLGNYTSSLSLLLNIATIGSQGRVERQMKEAGGDIKDIQRGVNKITAQLMATRGQEGSVMTSYEDDETAFWKELRRKLVKEGFTSSKIGVHKDIIQAYVKELADRGVLDEIIEIDPSALLSEPDSLRAVKRDVSPSPRTHCKTSGKSDKTPYAESEGSGHITNEERFEADDKAPRFNVANLKKQAAPLLLRDQQDPKDLSQPVFGLAVAERDLSESIKYSNSRYIEFSLEDCYNGVTKMMRVKRRRRNSSDLSIHLDEVIVAIKVKPSYMSDKRIKFAGLGDDTEDGQRHDLHVVLTQVLFSLSVQDMRTMTDLYLRSLIRSSSAKVTTLMLN